MQKGLFLIICSILVGVGWYFFERVEAICPMPLEYRIGRLDTQFALSEAEAKDAVERAAAVWEDEFQENLFEYNPDAAFTINFIFDERQEASDVEAAALTTLTRERASVDELARAFRSIENDLTNKRDDFEYNNVAYEEDLRTYNAEVARHNESGGAPQAEYVILERERARLERVASHLQDASDELRMLGDEFNVAAERYNIAVNTYNTHVRNFNQQYAVGREFTQGDYQGDEVHIYSFHDEIELQWVLAHELGHALSLDHIDNPEGLMYYLVAEETDAITLTEEDKVEFLRKCGADVTFWQKLRHFLEAVR